MPKRDGVLYYVDDDGKKQDAELHQSILDEGDDEAALEISRKVMRDLGLDPTPLLGQPGDVTKKKRQRQMEKLRAQAQALLGKGQFLKDPVTGLFEGSLPGPGHGEGTGGGDGGGKDSLAYAPGVYAYGYQEVERVQAEWMKSSAYKGMDAQGIADHAKESQAVFADAAAKIDQKTGATFVNPGSKGVKRLREKIVDDKRPPESITDGVRGGFKVKTPQQANAVIEELKKTHRFLDQGWQKTKAGYFDRKLIVRMPGGELAEIQLWPPEMYEAKQQLGGQQMYEASRTYPEGHPTREALNDKMRVLYGKAASRLDSSWNAIAGKGGN